MITHENIIKRCKAMNVDLLQVYIVADDHALVLCDRKTEFEPYATWSAFPSDEGAIFEHGHYIQKYERAIADFFKRVQGNSVEGILKHFSTDDILSEAKARPLSEDFESYRKYFAGNASAFISEHLTCLDKSEIARAFEKLFMTLDEDQIEILSDTEVGYGLDSYLQFIEDNES